ncbi:hypothetical protein M5K25_016411 [Dendrobium thyrsiflorum]|uniref:Uncharacterized protein n=1 Tax=Dendrobium thyrsiflorum TaxID=117978 RepID=A0ABD0URQ4_DENTH
MVPISKPGDFASVLDKHQEITALSDECMIAMMDCFKVMNTAFYIMLISFFYSIDAEPNTLPEAEPMVEPPDADPHTYISCVFCFEKGDIDQLIKSLNQVCTEMVMPLSSRKENSIFSTCKFDYPAFSDDCIQSFGFSNSKLLTPNKSILGISSSMETTLLSEENVKKTEPVTMISLRNPTPTEIFLATALMGFGGSKKVKLFGCRQEWMPMKCGNNANEWWTASKKRFSGETSGSGFSKKKSKFYTKRLQENIASSGSFSGTLVCQSYERCHFGQFYRMIG